MLSLRLTVVDPNPTLAAVDCRIAKGTLDVGCFGEAKGDYGILNREFSFRLDAREFGHLRARLP